MSLFLSTSLFVYLGLSADWEYDEPGNNASHWKSHYPECGGSHQSPVDLPTDSDCGEDLSLSWTSELVHFAVRNKGHSLQAVPFEVSDISGSDISRLEVLHHRNDTNIRLENLFYDTYESAVNSEYCFDSLHFHWGIDDESGSEHTVNNEHYPLEVHLVHFSCDHYIIGDALSAYSSGQLADDYDDTNILAVIGVLFEIGEANPVLDSILSDIIVDGVKYHDPEQHENMIQLFYTEFDPMDLLPEDKEFIGYQGSLTTPPCYETVRWHVMKNTMTVSEEQMANFRLLLSSTNDSDPIAPNWRPTQEIGNRTLYQCDEDIEADEVEKEDAHEHVWSYSNTSQWAHLGYEECDGNYQSPIDVITANGECEEVLLLNWTSEAVQFGVMNNGHSLQANPFDITYLGDSDITHLEVLHHTNDTNIRLRNLFYNNYKSNINEEYCFDSLHFHWGVDNDYGSEHTLDGDHYPLEVHLVHYSCDFRELADAVAAYKNDELSDGDDHHVLAVIGVLYEIGDANPALDNLLSDSIVHNNRYYDPESATEGVLELFYTQLDIMDLLPNNKAFIGYSGSLTTPPCYETVRWHMMQNTMTLSLEQMRKFRSLLASSTAGDYIAPNWRPVQNMGDRNKYQCKEEVVAQSVDKDEIDDRGTEEPQAKEDDIWFIVGVVFICLFVVAVVIIAYLSYMLYGDKKGTNHKKGANHKKGSTSYEQARAMDSEAEDLAVTETADYH